MKTSLFFCALLLSTAASAQPSTNRSATGANAGAADPNAVICRNQRTRVCKTRAEWDADRRDNRQAIDRNQATRTTTGG